MLDINPEPGLEALLLRLIPTLGAEWSGVQDFEREAIERLAGRPLPDFYHWFLARMGASMGAAEFGRIDFSAARVLRTPRPEGLDARYFPIGYQDDPDEYYYCYDLESPVRGDAGIVMVDADGDVVTRMYETFREMISFGNFLQFRLPRTAQRCDGWLEVSGGKTVSTELAPVLTARGFSEPVATGPYVGIFDRDDAALVCKTRNPANPLGVEHFTLGGPSVAALRRILGEVTIRSSIEVKVHSWRPPVGAA
ncbi:SMI1/KNR4 family protein [Nannocystis sp. ILAH1]|uniref:SMI1/KNR4 family protein n=1 Tax=Nannocystis sp. ILAH1 TaxID=2996789 RepID=UPI00226DF51E|nr:SMI1/KNR4 family protein [Nannocystis sp. ILAH1]MCY0991085.1 SMI1/KNR4 family protein [Nannocystis sp. ILAH1]